MLAVVAALSAVLVPNPATAAAPTCATAGYAVTSVGGPNFYIEGTNPADFKSSYTGYKLTNASGSDAADVWVQLSGFTGGALGLGTGQPAAQRAGDLASGGSNTLFWYLTASTTSATAQNHAITVYSHNPALPNAVVLCVTSGGFTSVSDTIGANPNKVTGISLSSGTPNIGSLFTITVVGDTGTMGAGKANDPEAFWMSPNVLQEWPAGAFRLVGTSLVLNGVTQPADTLSVQNAAAHQGPYTAKYTFRAVGFTSSASTVKPVQQIASGTQVKHTGSYTVGLPQVQPPTNSATIDLTGHVSRFDTGGGTLDMTATVTGAAGALLDSFVLTPPSGATLVPGSVKYDGATVTDGVVSGSTVVFPGPFTVPADGSAGLSYSVVVDGDPGNQEFSILGQVGTAYIGTAVTPLDGSNPATYTVAVNAPPVTTDPIGSVADTDTKTYTPSQLATDADSDTITVTGVGSASHGAAAIVDGDVVYTPTVGYSGSDTFTYTVTDARGGTASGTVTLTVTTAAVSPEATAQTITFASVSDGTVGDTFTPTPSASSGLTVVVTSSTPGVCTVEGGVVSLVAAGTCTLDADQAGNATYAAAPTVSRSLVVAAVPVSSGPSPSPQTITFAQPSSGTIGDTFTPAPTASSGLGVVVGSSTPGVCTVDAGVVSLVASGTCTLDADQAGNGTFAAAPRVSRSFVVTAVPVSPSPSPQTITFAQPSSGTIGDTFTPAPTASSGLTVVVGSSTTGVCTVDAGVVSLVTSGTCTLDADQAGNATYAAAPTVSRSFAVVKKTQTVTFSQPVDGQVGDTRASAAAASSGLAVTLTSQTPDVCSVSGGTITMIATGTCTIDADQAGNGTFTAAPRVSRSFTVTAVPVSPGPSPSPSPQTITFAQPSSGTIGDTFTPAPSASSGLGVVVGSSTPGVCTVEGGVVSLVAAGTCTLDADQGGNGSFSAAPTVSHSFAVVKRSQTITFASVSDGSVGDTFTPLPTASSGLEVVVTSSTPGVCTVDAGVVSLAAAGTCTLDADQAGNATYAAAPTVSRSLVVAAVPVSPSPSPQTITFAQPSSGTIGDTFTPAPTASSGLGVVVGSSTPGVCTVDAGVVSLLAAGTCTLDADQAGNGSYAAAPTVSRSFAVVKKTQAITFASISDATVGDTRTIAPTASSGLTVVMASSTPAVCTVEGGVVSLVAAGTCSLDTDQPGNATYAPAPTVSHSFAVVKQTQTITFASVSDGSVGDTRTIAPSASSGLAVVMASSTLGVCTVDAGVVSLVAAGTCTITAEQPGNATYAAAATVTRSLAVTKQRQVITLDSIAAGHVGDTLTPMPVATSGLPVTLGSSTPSVCTASGSVVRLVAAGTCTITADQAGNDSWLPADQETRSFAVGLVPQTITVIPPSGMGAGSVLDLGPVASSGLSVTVASLTPAVCVVSGGAVTALAQGVCSLVASQDGNSIFGPAPTVSLDFPVTPLPQSQPLRTQTIDFPVPAVLLSGPDAVEMTGTATSQLPLTLVLVSGDCALEGDLLTAAEDTTCVVSAGQPGDDRWAPAESVTRTIQFVSPADDIVSMGSPLTGSTTLAVDVLANDPSGLEVERSTPAGRGSTAVAGDGIVTYTPPVKFHGVDEFSYQVRDSLGRTAWATVSVDVANRAPVVAAGDITQLATSTKSIRFTASDPNDDDLTLAAKPARHVEAAVEGDRVWITPDATVSGWTTVLIRATDGAGGVGTAEARSLVRPLPVRTAYRRLVDQGTRVSWPLAATTGARYRVLVDGQSACVTTASECVLRRVLGPDYDIEVQVLGRDGTRSSKVAAEARGHRQVLFATVYFESGARVLVRSERRVLAQVARKIRRLGFHDAHVSGYTDTDGGAAFNRRLSRHRTHGVADYLSRTRDIDSRQAWFGYDDPVAPNDSETGRSLNRRVEILVSY